MFRHIYFFILIEKSRIMKKFNLFKTFTGDGFGIDKDDKYNEIPTNFLGFFVMLGRKFWNLSSLNLLYAVCNFPVFFFLYTLTMQLHDTVTVVLGPMFPAFRGLALASSDPSVLNRIYPYVSSFTADYVNTTAVYVFWAISALFLITFGLTNTGAAYIIRGYNRGDPIFLVSDFFGCINRNLRQGLCLGILDITFAFALFYAFTFWQSQAGFMSSVFMYMSLFLLVIYIMMRFYIYTVMITFKLSIFKIIKNSFILAILGFKRNILAFLGVFVLIYLSLMIFFSIPSIGIMLPVIITLSIGMFMCGYASYPVINKYMIAPFYGDSNENNSDDGDDEPVFVDRG